MPAVFFHSCIGGVRVGVEDAVTAIIVLSPVEDIDELKRNATFNE